MFVPPEQRRSWSSPEPEDKKSKSGENLLLFLIVMVVLSALLGPIGGATLVQAFVAIVR